MESIFAFLFLAAADLPIKPDPVSPLVHLGASVGFYLFLLLAGQIFRRQTNMHLGWFYQIFAVATAVYLPTLYPHYNPETLEHASAAAMVISGAFVLVTLLRKYLWEFFFARKPESKVPKFLSEFIALILILIAILIVLHIYDKDNSIKALLTASGIAGLALGFALQDLLGNVISGFTIYFGGQFKAGDWLLIENRHVEIMEINWRSTRMRTNDHVYLDVPNTKITKDMVMNFNFPTSLHAMRVEIGVDYDSPPTFVKSVLTQAALTAPDVLKDPAPVIYLKEFAAYSVVYEIKYWLNDHSKYNQVFSDVRTNIWYGLRRNGIKIPYPIQTEIFAEISPPKESPDEAIREALMKVSFAECLSAHHIRQLTESANVVQFGKGEHITEQGQEGDSMFILMRGSAEVLIFTNGIRSSVAKLDAGDCIGEMSLLTGERRSATVIAIEDCDAVEIDKKDISPIISETPHLLDSLSNLLAQRKIQIDGVVAEAGEHTGEDKRKEYSAGFLRKLRTFFDI